jgi:hypothetical protein
VQVCAQHLLMMINALRDNLCLMTGALDLAPTQVRHSKEAWRSPQWSAHSGAYVRLSHQC